MSIKDWPASERPREKLLQHGVKALTDAELLAILVRVGIRGLSAVDLSRLLLNKFGSLNAVFSAPQWDLCQQKGIGDSAFVQFQVVIEISRRLLKETITTQPCMSDSQIVTDYLRLKLGNLPHECLLLLYLDCQHKIINLEKIAVGSIAEQKISMRELVQAILKYHASAIILVHNHPSGSNHFSKEDIAFTNKIMSVLKPIDVEVLDHFLVTNNQVTSLRSTHILK